MQKPDNDEEVNEIDTSHIVSDIFQLNNDIITAYSKYPKKISFFLEKRKRNKLIKQAERLANSNVPLRTPNVFEFMTHMYNNYSKFVGDNKKYFGVIDILRSTIDDVDVWTLLLEIDDSLTCEISIDMMNSERMTLMIVGTNPNDITNTYNFTAARLYSTNRDFGPYCERINHHLLSIITEYVVDTLELYNKKG